MQLNHMIEARRIVLLNDEEHVVGRATTLAKYGALFRRLRLAR